MQFLSSIPAFCKVMKKLVKNDLKSKYSGSALGIIWAYIQPMITILVFWYVFQVGFKNPPVENVAYILWFITGFIPWTYFNDAMMTSTNVFREYSYLVMKMKFKIWQLPFVKVFSALVIHVFFVLFILLMYIIYGYRPAISWLSVPYYMLCMTVLLIGLAFTCASVTVLLKDAAQLVGIILQLGFWVTPIFWAKSSMNEGVLKVLKLNPLFYIIEGYRDCLIDNVGFWQEEISQTLYFWIFTAVFCILGAFVYNKLKDHFADLL